MNSADDNLNPIKSESAETEKNESENISTELKAPSSANNSFNPVRNKEDEEKANRNALISAFWFFGGTLLHFWCLIFQDASELAYNLLHNSLIYFLLFISPIGGLFIIIFNKAKYPWHKTSSVLLTIYIILIVIVNILIAIALIFLISLCAQAYSSCAGSNIW